jgi:hypothetical protein
MLLSKVLLLHRLIRQAVILFPLVAVRVGLAVTPVLVMELIKPVFVRVTAVVFAVSRSRVVTLPEVLAPIKEELVVTIIPAIAAERSKQVYVRLVVIVFVVSLEVEEAGQQPLPLVTIRAKLVDRFVANMVRPMALRVVIAVVAVVRLL